MGGKLFASGASPLLTPRMLEHIYLKVQKKGLEVLGSYFTHVATPIQAPKKDYGDVDFLVADPTPGQGPPTREALSKALGAERYQNTSFAIPWPKDSDINNGVECLDETNRESKRFVQVDVTICQHHAAWEWELFQHAHGDLWNILGSMIRSLGLTTNNNGFYLRIEDIDVIDRKKSMILLTQKPSEVLEFLGLDTGRWAKQFDSVQELYEYAASCRFFFIKDVSKDTEEDKRQLKHNDRKRMNSRPVFAKWVEEFLPECRATGRFNKQVWSREQVRDEVFERFGVKNEYKRRLTSFQQERQRDEIWRVAIKLGVPADNVDPELRGAAIRGLKDILIEGNLRHGIIPANPLKDDDGFFVMEEVHHFIKGQWRQVGRLEMKRQRERADEQSKLKAARKENVE